MGHQTFLAIDSPTTRDVDDAIAITPISGEAAGWDVSVLIANPAAFVPLGSAEDAFARKQGATVYMAQRTVQSMLPRQIAERKAALVAGERRPALKIDLRISESFDVAIKGLSFKDIAIGAHVPYTTVAERARNEGDELHGTLRLMIAVSQGLLASRRRHGALAYYDLNRLLFLDEEGRMKQAKNADDAIGQVLVQEFMILANAAIASWAVEHDLPILFRNHHAKNAAPPATDLAKTVQGWLSGTSLNGAAAREQLEMILGVANYGASLEGHYALNLPAYTHGTSPIRRYADLVNQRQLFAALAGVTPPYTKTDLVGIAGEVNETLAQRRQERSDGFKETVVRRATQALNTQRFETLADHELSQALKLASANGDYPDALVATVADRIRQGVLSDKVFDRLIEAPGGSLPRSIAEAWADLLTQVPPRACHLINYGLQAGLFADYQTNPTRKSPDDGPFIDRSTITRVADGVTLQAVGTSTKKQDASNIAAARLVMAHLGITPPTAKTAPTAASATQTSINHKGRLQERCQKQRWAMPRFETRMEGPTNAAVFHCTVTLRVGQQDFSVSSPAGSPTRIGAEQAAAEALLLTLPTGQTTSGQTSGTDNPIGALQERCQKAGHPLPTYMVRDAADGTFACTVQAAVIPGLEFSASAPSKADAKRAAAAKAMAHLIQVTAAA